MQVTQSEFTAESLAEHLQVEICKIDRITLYALNPRRHDEAVDQMCVSLLEYGLKWPLLVRGDGELVDGHLRWKAATKLGFKVVPSPAARYPLVYGATRLVGPLAGGPDPVQLVAGSEPDPVGGGNLEETVTSHGSPKPVDLMKRSILSHTERGDDTLLGSGTTLLVAKLSGGSCLDVEIEPRYAERLHALSLGSGKELLGGPVDIQATYPGTGPNSSGGVVTFVPGDYKARPAL